jgi:alkylation response protein AidB-like acyl-CoA dehydrogenase
MVLRLSETRQEMQATSLQFVAEEVVPAASPLEHADQYPVETVNCMAELGLFGGILLPEEYGGADMATQTKAARLLTWSAALQHDRGEPPR